MNVLLFTHRFLPDVGGMEYAVHYLAQALCDNGHEVSVMALRTTGNGDFMRTYHLFRYGSALRGARRLGFNKWSAHRAVTRLFRDGRIDVANVHNVAGAPRYVMSRLRKLGIPTVLTPHGRDIQRVPEISYGVRLRDDWDNIVREHLRAADAVTAISQSVQRELDFLPRSDVFPIPNGIRRDLFARRRCHYLHDRLGLPHEWHVILSVGREHEKKGYEHGIRVAKELYTRHGLSHGAYCIIGRGVSRWHRLVRELALEGRVFLEEEIPPAALAECYNSSDIFFSPSVVEGFSLVSVEAMACGIPIVATDVPGNRDIVLENDCGVLVEVNNVQHMARSLAILLQDEKQRNIFSERGDRKADDYDWHRVAEKYVEAYTYAIAKHRQQALSMRN